MGAMNEIYAEDILDSVHRAMSLDIDVRGHAGVIVKEMWRLLDSCDIEKMDDADDRDDYTTQLVDKFVSFVACGKIPLGGSAAEYCGENALKGTHGYRLRLHDDEEANLILHEMREEFHARAWEPGLMFAVVSRAGIPIGRH